MEVGCHFLEMVGIQLREMTVSMNMYVWTILYLFSYLYPSVAH